MLKINSNVIGHHFFTKVSNYSGKPQPVCPFCQQKVRYQVTLRQFFQDKVREGVTHDNRFGGFTHLVRQLVFTGTLRLKQTDKKRCKPQSLMHVKSLFRTGASHV